MSPYILINKSNLVERSNHVTLPIDPFGVIRTYIHPQTRLEKKLNCFAPPCDHLPLQLVQCDSTASRSAFSIKLLHINISP